MIVFSIHPLSVLLGFFIGYIVFAAIWIWESNRGDFGRGWDYGYEYGKGVGRSEMLKELEKKKEGDQK